MRRHSIAVAALCALLFPAASATRGARGAERVLVPAAAGGAAAAAAAASDSPLPFCDSVLCLPKRRLLSRRDYCSAPHSIKGTRCVTPDVAVASGSRGAAPGRGAATTLGKFCAAHTSLAAGARPSSALPHNDPSYRGEGKWCKAGSSRVVLPPEYVVAVVLRAAPLPPWAADEGASAPACACARCACCARSRRRTLPPHAGPPRPPSPHPPHPLCRRRVEQAAGGPVRRLLLRICLQAGG